MTAWPPAPANLPLAQNHVHLFLATIADPIPPDILAQHEQVLSAPERARIHQLRLPDKRAHALVSRALLRHLLAKFLPSPPNQIEIALTPTGKPYLPNHPLHFNLSHTTDRLLIALSQNLHLGIDIETLNPTLDWPPIAKNFFTPAETTTLLSLPPPAQLPAFTRLWTRKESLLKLTAQGLATPNTTPHPPHTLTEIPLDQSHLATLATFTPPTQIHTWHLPLN